jgi:AbrB family looped-hinge helix DNA binding protein
MNSYRAKISESGRLSIPSKIRKEMGLAGGGDVVLELDGNELRLRTVDAAVARAQEITRRVLAGNPKASVDDFLAERRREARRE